MSGGISKSLAVFELGVHDIGEDPLARPIQCETGLPGVLKVKLVQDVAARLARAKARERVGQAESVAHIGMRSSQPIQWHRSGMRPALPESSDYNDFH